MSSSKILRGQKDCTSYVMAEIAERVPGRDGLKSIKDQAADILKEARTRKEAIEMEAYRQGLEQGQAEGQKMAMKRLEPLAATFKNAIAEVETLREQLTEKHLEEILQIIVLIAEKVVHREIHLTPDTILNTVRAASAHLAETDEIIIRLHPSDYEYTREIEELLTTKLTGRRGITFVEDTAIDRGGVMIETELGDIDATIRSQIDLIRETLQEGA